MKRKMHFLLALVLALCLTAPALAADSGFTDVPDNHWASSYIRRAYEADWVHGMGDGKYVPAGTLTRAQFLTMVTNAFFSEDLSQTSVPDGSPWYAACWSVTQANNLHAGTSMQRLGDLQADISRYDMAQVIVNTLSGEGITASDAAAQEARAAIRDWSSVPAGYRDAVSGAYALSIIVGRNGGFEGNATMTRAEAATVLCRMDDAISGGAQTPGTGAQTPNTPKPDSQKPSQDTAAAPEELTAEVVRLVNEERAKEGLSPLDTYDSLTRAAQIRAPEIVTLFSHDRPDGTKCYTAMDQTGASEGTYTRGENIAAGSSTAAAVVEQWMNSPGHRANILNPQFTHIGVGYQYDAGSSYRHYWVQMFAGLTSAPDSAQTPGGQKPDGQKPESQKPAQDTAATPEELAAEVVRLVNAERAKEGLSPLGTYDSLTRAAQIRSPEIVTLFSHDRPDGTSCFTAMDQTGAKKGAYTWGENIAAGNATAADTVEQWMNSPGHRANILNPQFTHIGVGYQYDANSAYRHYWVQMFAGTNSVPDSSQTPSTQPPSTQTPDAQRPSQQLPSAGEGGLLFSSPTITIYPGGAYSLSVLEHDMRRASGVTWTNESPDLLRLNGNGSSVTAVGDRGTGYLTASRGGETIRLTVRVIPTADQIALSCLSTTMQVDGYGSTELYIFSTSKFYGQDCTVTWSVDDPSVLTLEERTSSQGNPAVRFKALRTGDACVTCRVTMADGSTAEEYCFAHVR